MKAYDLDGNPIEGLQSFKTPEGYSAEYYEDSVLVFKGRHLIMDLVVGQARLGDMVIERNILATGESVLVYAIADDAIEGAIAGSMDKDTLMAHARAEVPVL